MLICDAILQNRYTRDAEVMDEGWDALRTDMREAHKFVLDRSLAAAADAIEAEQIEKVLSSCRVPFQNVWIECLQADRPKFAAAPLAGGREAMGITDLTQLTPIRKIKRIGMLIKTNPDSRSRFVASLIWSFPDDYCNASLMMLRADLEKLTDPGQPDELSNHLLSLPSPYYLKLFELVSKANDGAGLDFEQSAAFRQVMKEAMADWAHEPQFWLGVLALLNCRNVAETKTVDVSGVNRARAKRGRPLFAEHKILTLRLPAARRAASSGNADADRAAMRGHFVRGHFKERKTGLFYWSDFARGDMSRMIHKTYKPMLKEDA